MCLILVGIFTSDRTLTYHYKSDPNIQIGVLGMIDDTLAITKCGNNSVRKNAILNSFVETQKLTLSKTKSVVIHIGKKQKCKQPCPKLSIHKSVMKEETSAKYLGDIITCKGGVRETLENQRNRGCGKIAEIMGTL